MGAELKPRNLVFAGAAGAPEGARGAGAGAAGAGAGAAGAELKPRNLVLAGAAGAGAGAAGAGADPPRPLVNATCGSVYVCTCGCFCLCVYKCIQFGDFRMSTDNMDSGCVSYWAWPRQRWK